MYPRVTAIIVARNGAEYLQRTLDALAAQTRRPDRIITVDCASSDDTGSLLVASAPDHALTSAEELSFGQAIAAAVRVTEPPTSENEMLWLLAHDSAPDAGALASLIAALEISPSVGVAGPKLMDWDSPSYIAEFGQTITPFGTAVVHVADELDQEQHDIRSDVMAVSAAGMLVRHRIWDELGGFDPGLPVVDDALDFCVRVRLHGSRVTVVPSAKILSAGDGIAGRDTSPANRSHRVRARRRRRAQLHRRLSWAPAAAVPIHWLSLVPLAIVRSIMLLLRKDPGLIIGELASAFGAAFNGMPVSNARRSIARIRTASWSSLAPLRMPSAEVSHRRALERETGVTTARGEREPTHFFSGGGAWTVLAAAAVGALVYLPLMAAPALAGGGLLPLSSEVATLWQSASFGWHEIGLGFVGAADPFAAVLAVLGSLTFWAPSLSLVLLWVLALPLAAFGAWMASTRITERAWLRALAAVLWTLAPPLLTALQDGRPGPLLAHLLLPWLVFAAASAARSWSASAASALLFAAIVACAPSLMPALLVLWLGCVVLSGRNFTRFIAIPVPALVLAAPLIWQQWTRGTPLALLADPGVVQPSAPASVQQLLLGFPDGGLGGWPTFLARFGAEDVPLGLIIPLILAPLALAAVFSLFVRGSRRGIIAVFAALLGLATAVGANQLVLSNAGDSAASVWAGSGLSLYWLGIVAAAVLGLTALGRFAVAPALVVGLVSVVVAVPLAIAVPLGTAAVRAGDGTTLPAFVIAEAGADPGVGTLELTPQNNGGLLATLVRGAGATLDAQSTLRATDPVASAADKRLAKLAGNLASNSGLDPVPLFSELGVRFVLLHPIDAGAPAAAEATEARTLTSLDGTAALVPVGETAFGTLWRLDGTEVQAPKDEAPGPLQAIILASQLLVFGFVLLLSIPTGAGREAARRRRRQAQLRKRAARAAARKKLATPRVKKPSTRGQSNKAKLAADAAAVAAAAAVANEASDAEVDEALLVDASQADAVEPDDGASADGEPESDPAADAEPDADVEPESDAATGAEQEADPEPQADAATGAETEDEPVTGVVTESERAADPEQEVDPAADAEPESDAATGMEPETDEAPADEAAADETAGGSDAAALASDSSDSIDDEETGHDKPEEGSTDGR